MKDFFVIIPARYDSTRLPGKPLLEIAGKPLIQYVYESASKSQAQKVLVATDDERIAECARSFTDTVIMTSREHQSGTDRLAEVVAQIGLAEDAIVVNVQGDGLGLPVSLINQVAEGLSENPDKQMATLCERINNEQDFKNPNIVKVIFDENNTAIYFSRMAIPWQQEFTPSVKVYKHIGIYAYRSGFLKEYLSLAPCELEQSERLEQLRVIYYGNKIHVDEATESTGIEVNTAEDLEQARRAYS